MRPAGGARLTMAADQETIMLTFLTRHLRPFAILVMAAPLLLSGCRDNADPVKPKVAPASVTTF